MCKYYAALFICIILTTLGEDMRNFIAPEYKDNKDHSIRYMLDLHCKIYVSEVTIFKDLSSSWRPPSGVNGDVPVFTHD